MVISYNHAFTASITASIRARTNERSRLERATSGVAAHKQARERKQNFTQSQVQHLFKNKRRQAHGIIYPILFLISVAECQNV